MSTLQITVESQGGTWNEATSEARNYKKSSVSSSSRSSGGGGGGGGGMHVSQTYHDFRQAGSGGGGGGGYQNGGGAAQIDLHSSEFRAQKEDFFSRKQNENASRPE